MYNEGFLGNIINFKRKMKKRSYGRLQIWSCSYFKNIKGENRIEEFKHSCLLRGYIINEISIKNKIDIYNAAQEEIIFE